MKIQTQHKIMELDPLSKILEQERQKGKRIVLCHGVFDILHIGHIRYFQEAKSYGDVLIVTITPDRFVNKGPNRPYFSQDFRTEAIAALEMVDFVAINEWPTAIETILLLKPDFYVKGPDYKNVTNDITGNIQREEEVVRSVGGKLVCTDTVQFSSSSLINERLSPYSSEQKDYLTRLKEKYTLSDIVSYFNTIQKLHVVVVGEAIVDEYVFCNPLGKSGKEPILVSQKLSSQLFSGGSLLIANHLSEFVKEVTLLSYIGQNREYEAFMMSQLKPNVRVNWIEKTHSPTILKRRYLDHYSKAKLFGIYELNDELLREKEETQFCSQFITLASEADAVIVSDYGHGLITHKAVEALIKYSPILCVNTQLNAANIGFHTISKYPSFHFGCIHEGELRQDFRSRTQSVEELTQRAYEKLKCEKLIITRGSNGALAYSKEEAFIYCPAFADKIVDRMGGGDALFGIVSLCHSIKMPMELSLFVGNLASSFSVASLGPGEPIQKINFLKTIETMLK